jgi:asparagine synthase (glutamine-hydrolysing)
VDRHGRGHPFHELALKYAGNPILLKTAILTRAWEPENVYRRSVTAAAANGAQAWFPFTDLELRRFVSELPVPYRLRGGTNKVLLRAMMRRHLPPKILDRPKGYFVSDPTGVLMAENGSLVREVLSHDSVKAMGVLDPTVVDRCLASYLARPGGLRMYALAVLQWWIRDRSHAAQTELPPG